MMVSFKIILVATVVCVGDLEALTLLDKVKELIYGTTTTTTTTTEPPFYDEVVQDEMNSTKTIKIPPSSTTSSSFEAIVFPDDNRLSGVSFPTLVTGVEERLCNEGRVKGQVPQHPLSDGGMRLAVTYHSIAEPDIEVIPKEDVGRYSGTVI